MNVKNDVKLRLMVKLLCKLAKQRGAVLDDLVALLEEEWEKA